MAAAGGCECTGGTRVEHRRGWRDDKACVAALGTHMRYGLFLLLSGMRRMPTTRCTYSVSSTSDAVGLLACTLATCFNNAAAALRTTPTSSPSRADDDVSTVLLMLTTEVRARRV